MDHRKHMLVKLLPFCFLLHLSFLLPAYAQNTKVYGKVTDAITKEPLPFANVVFQGTTIGTTTDIDGNFLIETGQKVDSLLASSVGYKASVKQVLRNKPQGINFALEQSNVQLQEVVIKAGENPAIPFFKKIVANKDLNNKDNLDAYQYEVYNKVEFDVNNIPDELKNRKAFKSFNFVFDQIDSTGEKPYLPMFITETLSEVYYRKKPKALKEHIKAVKVSGIKNQSINQFLGDVYQNVNAYDNYILVFGKSFVSPIADFGMLYYKYYLVDSTFIDNQWCYKLTFMPKRRQEPTFAGELWVHDTTFALKKIDVSIASDANINFVNSFSASQEYEMVDGQWMLSHDRLTVDFNVTDKSVGMYGRKTTSYKNFTLNQPRVSEFYTGTEDVIVLEDASDKSDEFWNSNRHDSLSSGEKEIYALVDSIKSMPAFRTYVDVIYLLVSGYHDFGKIELGPYFTTYSFNAVEGNRFRLGGRTSNAFSTRLLIEGYGAYGLADKAFKYGGGFQYFLSKTPRQFIGASYKYDMEQLGQSPNALMQDNILGSFRRVPFNKLTLVDEYKAYYEREWFAGFSSRLTFQHRILMPRGELNYKSVLADMVVSHSDITTTDFVFKTRFAYKEKFVSGEFDRVSLGTNYPVFQIQYTLGIKDLLSSDYGYHKAAINVSNFVRTQPLGYLDYEIEAGRVWGTLPYPLLELHNGNETYSYDRYAFNMMNYFEFASDKYVSINLIQHFNGFFFDKFPVLRKLKWREVVFGKGVIGSLDGKNRSVMILPANMTSLEKPYLEAGMGVENIFKIFRVDGIWRLTHLDKQNVSRFGVRATFAFNF